MFFKECADSYFALHLLLFISNYYIFFKGKNTTFVAKDKTVWSKVPMSQHQAVVRNIVRQRVCWCTQKHEDFIYLRYTFKKIMSNEMIVIIVRCTNKKVLAVYEEYNISKTSLAYGEM